MFEKENAGDGNVALGANYAAREAGVLLVGAAGYAMAAMTMPQMPVALAVTAACLALGGVCRLPPAVRQMTFESRLIGDRKPYCLHSELVKLCRNESIDGRWVGFGFLWGTPQCQRVQELLCTDWKEAYHSSLTRAKGCRYLRKHWISCLTHPGRTLSHLRAQSRLVAVQPGFRWMHAMGEEKSKILSSKELEGHLAVFGTTGSGKSRFLEIQVAQAILQNQCVIVLDPKGDKGLEATMRKFCHLAGRDQDFLYFHVAHPENSVNLNLLANFRPGHSDEVGSRIAETLPGQGGEGQVFVDMARGYLKTICDGLTYINKKPTFKRLYFYFNNRILLAVESLTAYLKAQNRETEVDRMLASAKTLEDRLDNLRALYMAGDNRPSEMEGILGLADFDEVQFRKMTQSVWQVLGTLTRGELGEKLSPEESISGRLSMFYDTRKIMERRSVLYVGLDAMADPGLARSLGSMLLSDLTAAAGARYDFEAASAPVALFVDEAAEMMCEPFTQLLNKSRGAKFCITLAAQTVSDFIAKAKNPAEARRILANVNNLVALRCTDEETQKFVLQRVLKTRTQTTMKTHGVSAGADQLMAVNGTSSERLVEEEVDLIPPALLGALPNGEYFGVFSGGHVLKGRVPVLVESAAEYKED